MKGTALWDETETELHSLQQFIYRRQEPYTRGREDEEGRDKVDGKEEAEKSTQKV